MHFALRESMMAALGFYILFSWSSSLTIASPASPSAPFSSPDATFFVSQEEPRSSCTLHDREHGCSKLSPLRLHQRLPSSPNLLPSPNCKTVHRLDQPTIPIPNLFCVNVSSGRCSSPLYLLFPDDNSGPLFFCAGFYCVSPCTTATFGVYTNPSWPLPLDEAYATYPDSVLVVWSANHDRQVQKNATLS
jgi:hypothetical protein